MKSEGTKSVSTKAVEHSSEPREGLDGKAELELEKLHLEIRELKRSPWTKPAVVIPIAATLLTLGLSQYLGIFEVERKRVEIAAREAKIEQGELVKQITFLREKRGELAKERNDLSERKAGLARDVQRLESELAKRTRERGQLLADAAAVKKELQHTKAVLAQPALAIGTDFLPQEKRAMLYIANRGRGLAKIEEQNLYVDGVPMSTGSTVKSFWGETLDALDINKEWLSWTVRKSSIEAGSSIALLSIVSGEFNPTNEALFRYAIGRFGLEVCYCSVLGECQWATYNRPEITTASCKR